MDAKTTPTASEKTEPFEGLVAHEGGSTPTSDPHVCAFLRIGASKARCLELTSIYNRNIEGCCGTSDNRSFPPCNSQWRKCRECIADGRGSKSGSVVDVKRGLCEEHEHKAGATASAPVIPAIYVPPARVAIKRFEPTVPPKPAERPVRGVVVEVSRKPSTGRAVEAPVRLQRQGVDASPAEAYDAFDQEVLSSFNLEKALKRYRRLTNRNKQVAGYLVRGQLPPDLSVKSVASLRSSMFNALGIPRIRMSVRLDLLRQVVERHDMLEAMSPTNRAVEEPPNAIMTTEEREIRLLTHFRALPQLEQDQVEQMLKALVLAQKQSGG